MWVATLRVPSELTNTVKFRVFPSGNKNAVINCNTSNFVQFLATLAAEFIATQITEFIYISRLPHTAINVYIVLKYFERVYTVSYPTGSASSILIVRTEPELIEYT